MNNESKLDIYLGKTSPHGAFPRRPRFKAPKIGYLRGTGCGEIWVVDWFFEEGYLHGRYELNRVDDIPNLIDDNLSDFNPSEATVIDTETTGLAGGTGTYAFIIGAGFWRENEFIVRQYMMRDFNEEPAQLTALTEDFAGSVITYNGKCFDIPLLTNRYRLHRFDSPFENVKHLDMLYPSRRIWKRNLPGFKLTQMEELVLGYAREDDIPSHLIPSIFFDYLQTRDEKLLYPILNHNRDDILSLYHLCAMASRTVNVCIDSGSNDDNLLLSLAEICFKSNDYDSAIQLVEKIRTGFASKQTLKEACQLKALSFKRLGKWEEAAEAFTGMQDIEPEIFSSIELAKLYEHKLKDPARALEIVRRVEGLIELSAYLGHQLPEVISGVQHRKNRLNKKVSRLLHN